MNMLTRTGLLAFLFALSLSATAQLSMAKDGSLTVIAEPEVEQLIKTYKSENSTKKTISGYRVQFYNGRKSESQKMKTSFVSTFPGTPVYHLYEAPEYKVQAGDFRTRLEAEKFLRQVIEEFGSGFVVKTKINPPALVYPIKQ